MQRVYFSVLRESFPSGYLFVLVNKLVVQFILMPNATQTNNESKSLDCLYFTVGDYSKTFCL